ncbi:hypothetical protein SAMN05421813_10651 [Daejeonella rubra]|uniref:WD40-like Beta Propeller Repeat n=1 Tax=Daejeonella rubra TaxID=990371 RepID=A0A1G9QKA2_9SPHI|nr:hypothetical protein [Daejeonella rubra]SDM10715.1 hypothetical protein SAMN05421813_10651 [Daejeonella rubra]
MNNNNHKYLFISILSTIILCFNSLYSFSQFFSNEQNPPGVKWEQINTSNFQIIYPTVLSDEARRMANTLEHIINGVSKSLNKTPRKISIILQNQSVISNGFVQLAPRRSEFYTTPPQNLDFQDWLNSLAVHELRHVVQFDKLTPGLKAPFFEELALAIFGISLPPWFFEGDAVGIETALSHAGRGRLPEWELIFRTNTLSNKTYSYSKNYLGSFKDRTPGYYQLGYFMTTKLRRDFGKGIMDSIMSRISRNPVRPYNLSNSIKKFTGMSSRTLHDSTITELKQLWQNQANLVRPSEYPKLNKRKDELPADYLFPVRIFSNKTIVLKHSLNNTPSLILIDESGNEKTLKKIGFQTEPNFKYAAGKLVWDELRFDVRYFKRSFNVINTYDIKSGVYKQITNKSRLFSPALSADGKKIVAVKVREDNRNLLVELDSETGTELKEYLTKSGQTLQAPSYNDSGDKIICVVTSKDGSSLIEFNAADGSTVILMPFALQQISRPVYAGNSVLFRAHYNGINNIYYIAKGSSEAKALTNVSFGASNPSYHSESNTVIFNNYQVTGYDIASVTYEPKTSSSSFNSKNNFIDYAAPLVEQEANSTILDNIPNNKYSSKPFKEIKNLFYFHSVSPIAEENDQNNELNIGLKLRSNNKLNTLDLYTGYQFNSGLKRSEYLAGITYKRFYPIFDLRYINRARQVNVRQNNSLVPVNWRENFTEMEVSVPFTFNKLNKTYNMGFLSSSSYTSRYEIQNKPGNFIENLEFPMKYTAYFSRNTQRSLRDLAPRWGQNFSISYFHLPFENQLNGTLLAFRSTLFAPGLFSNHSFQTSFNYQESNGAYEFNIEIPKISGYNNLRPTASLRNTLLIDYRFPLFYPDAEIGPLAYIKRIKGGLFADFENIGKGAAFQPRTFGLELSADMNLMRFFLPDFDLAGKLIFSNELRNNKPIFEIGFTYNY